MRFLKENCRHDDDTYILRRSPDGTALHLYDLSLASRTKQKKFKWMLAMLSYRFAMRLGHHIHLANAVGKILIRNRQSHLLRSCDALLEEIRALGGDDHSSIRAAVLEQMADIHLARVDDYNFRHNRLDVHGRFKVRGDDPATSSPPTGPGSGTVPISPMATGAGAGGGGGGGGGGVGNMKADFSHEPTADLHTSDDDDYDEKTELTEAAQLLSEAIGCMEALIRKEIEEPREGSSPGYDSSSATPTCSPQSSAPNSPQRGGQSIRTAATASSGKAVTISFGSFEAPIIGLQSLLEVCT